MLEHRDWIDVVALVLQFAIVPATLFFWRLSRRIDDMRDALAKLELTLYKSFYTKTEVDNVVSNIVPMKVYSRAAARAKTGSR